MMEPVGLTQTCWASSLHNNNNHNLGVGEGCMSQLMIRDDELENDQPFLYIVIRILAGPDVSLTQTTALGNSEPMPEFKLLSLPKAIWLNNIILVSESYYVLLLLLTEIHLYLLVSGGSSTVDISLFQLQLFRLFYLHQFRFSEYFFSIFFLKSD